VLQGFRLPLLWFFHYLRITGHNRAERVDDGWQRAVEPHSVAWGMRLLLDSIVLSGDRARDERRRSGPLLRYLH
jgi:hypothetical protein